MSVTSSAERVRRYETARVRLALAEARLEMILAAEKMTAGSQTGSVGRRLEDVQSEPGSNGPLTTPLPPTTENPIRGDFLRVVYYDDYSYSDDC